MIAMDIREFLNKKFFQLQAEKGSRIKVEEFARLFGAPQSLMSMWLNGERVPGQKYREKIIEMYGDEAAEAFGEDPDLQAIIINWEYLTPDERRTHRKAVEEQASKYEAKRAPKARRTRPS